MTEEIATAMKVGVRDTKSPRPRMQSRVMQYGDLPGMHIKSLSERRGGNPFGGVALVGGNFYLEVMRHFL